MAEKDNAKLSARELMAAHLGQINRVNPKLNASWRNWTTSISYGRMTPTGVGARAEKVRP